jgi:hypothetical protein
VMSAPAFGICWTFTVDMIPFYPAVVAPRAYDRRG